MSAFSLPDACAQTTTPAAEGLKSSDAKIRAKTARELGQSGDNSVIPSLVSALKDPEPKVRREVVVALATLQMVFGMTLSYVALRPVLQIGHLTVASLLLGAETVLWLLSRRQV